MDIDQARALEKEWMLVMKLLHTFYFLGVANTNKTSVSAMLLATRENQLLKRVRTGI